MGLDLTELVVGIEQSVGVVIPNDVAATLTTPRQLITYLYSQLPHGPSGPCLSQRAFYALRHALTERLGSTRSSLRPATELASVLPHKKASGAWKDVGRAVGARPWPTGPLWGWLPVTFSPTGPKTLGQVASYLAGAAAYSLKRPGEGWTVDEVGSVVAWQFAYHLAIREYGLDDRFREDMGLS
jgi:hypothetical protein